MPKKECSVDGCENIVSSIGYCSKHYMQFRRHGKILERTRKDPNEIVYHKDYAEIILYDKKSNRVAEALVDREDVEMLRKYKWYCQKYARAHIGGKLVFMHRLIMNPGENLIVDHINHNRLDNRKKNLKVCTTKENARNLKPKEKSLGLRGITEQKGRYIVTIGYDRKKVYIGTFSDIEKAKRARVEAEIKYWGRTDNIDKIA